MRVSARGLPLFRQSPHKGLLGVSGANTHVDKTAKRSTFVSIRAILTRREAHLGKKLEQVLSVNRNMLVEQ